MDFKSFLQIMDLVKEVSLSELLYKTIQFSFVNSKQREVIKTGSKTERRETGGEKTAYIFTLQQSTSLTKSCKRKTSLVRGLARWLSGRSTCC